MAKLLVKHVGPIRDGLGGEKAFHFSGVTVFTGTQGSGKSTAAKLYSSFTWLEKALVRGDVELDEASHYDFFLDNLMAFHGMSDYFSATSETSYEGEQFSFKLKGKTFSVSKHPKSRRFQSPKIMYVPAERNFLAAIDRPELITKLPKGLKDFLTEYVDAKEYFAKKPVKLHLHNTHFTFEESTKRSFIGNEDFKVDLLHASSGYQSFIPLVLVTRYLADFVAQAEGDKLTDMSVAAERRWLQELSRLVNNNNLTRDQKLDEATELMTRYTYSSFINIVEEPEQNLYPTSQKQALFEVLEASNRKPENRLLVTTHSPFIISYLNVSLEAHRLYNKLGGAANSGLVALKNICPETAAVAADRINVYEFQADGSISQLGKYEGILQDDNQLNTELENINETFADLLDLD